MDSFTGNLSLPQEFRQSIALFDFEVERDGSDLDNLTEVIAIYDQEKGDKVCSTVRIQLLVDPVNQVSIPLKKQASKAKLAELKLNLAKHLPRVVRVNQKNEVYLTEQASQKRIGRVLPHGCSVKELASAKDTSRLYQAESNTFRSMISHSRAEIGQESPTRRSSQT